jgi:hypothetical protein
MMSFPERLCKDLDTRRTGAVRVNLNPAANGGTAVGDQAIAIAALVPGRQFHATLDGIE